MNIRFISLLSLAFIIFSSKASVLEKDSIRYIYYSNTSSIADIDSLKLGFKPVKSENFKPLVKITGDIAVDTFPLHQIKLKKPYFIISIATGDTISQGKKDTIIAAKSLFSDSGIKIYNSDSICVTGDTLLPSSFRLENPVDTNTSFSYLQLGGKLKFSEFPEWHYSLQKSSYLRLDSGKALLPEFHDTIKISLNFQSAQFQFDSLFIYHHSDTIFDFKGKGSFKIDNTTLTSTFGNAGKAGIKLINGKLDSVNIIVKDSFETHGLKVLLKKGIIDFIKSDSSFIFFSDSAKIRFNSNVIDVGLGNKTNPGATFKKGTLRKMKLALTDSTNLFGLVLKTHGVTMEYNIDSSTFNLWGGPDTIAFSHSRKDAANQKDTTTTHKLVVRFGTEKSPGLVLKNGSLKSLDIGVTDTLNIDSTFLIFDDNHLTYNIDSNQFAMYNGEIKLKLKKDSIHLGLGTIDNPGILIKDGKLKNVRLSLLDTSQLFGLRIVGDSAVVEYNSDSSMFAMYGGKEQLIFSRHKKDSLNRDTTVEHKLIIDFGTLDNPGIKFSHGKFSHMNLGITDTLNFEKAQVAFTDDHLYYDTDSSEFLIYGKQVGLKFNESYIHLGLGDKDKPGLKIKNGQFKELHFTLLDTTKLFGLLIKGDSTTFEYNADSSMFQLYGGPDTIVFSHTRKDTATKKDTITHHFLVVDFGTDTMPGLRIKNGALDYLNIGLSDTINIDSTFLIFNKNRIKYIRDSGYIAICNGDVKLKLKKDSIHLGLGDDDHPGLLIQNGRLKQIRLTMLDTSKLFGLSIVGDSTVIEYNSDSSLFAMYGGKEQLIFSRHKKDSQNRDTTVTHKLVIDFGTLDNPGIKFSHGKFSHMNLGISDTLNFENAQVAFTDDHIYYDSDSSEFLIYGKKVGLKFKESYIHLGLGDKENPGLKLKNGQFKQLHFTLLDTTKLFGLQIRGDSTTFEYNADSSRFVLYGGPDTLIFSHTSKTASNKDTTSHHSLVVNFGKKSNPGLKIENGKLVHLNIALSSKIVIDKAELNFTDVGMSYDKDSAMYEIYGKSIKFKYKEDSLDVGLGDEQNAGISIKNGKLRHLQLTLNNPTKIMGLEIKGSKTTFEYSSDSSYYRLYGGPDTLIFSSTNKTSGGKDTAHKFSAVFDFGTKTNPGFVIKDGKLRHLNLGIADSLRLAGVLIKIKRLNFTYDKDSDYYALSGGPALIEYKGDSIGVDFGPAGSPGMVIKRGELKHLRLGLTAGANLFGLKIVSQGAYIDWDKNDDRFELGGGPVGLKYNEDSLFVKFGDSQNPGIIFKSGKLEKMEGSITSSFNVYKLEFKTKNLGLKYVAEKSRFEITQGSVKIKIAEDSLLVNFGTATQPGMVIDSGKVIQMNLTASANAKLFKLGCNVTNLSMEYNKPKGYFQIYGGPVSFYYEKDSIAGAFGDQNHPGILIENGSLKKFAMGITGKFKISNVSIEPKNLTFAYDIPNKRITIYNTLLVNIDKNSISCSLGDSLKPGLIIKDAQLDTLGIKITSDFTLSGIELKTVDAGINWGRTKKETQLFGSYQIKKFWSVDLSLGTSTNPGIKIGLDANNKSTFQVDNLKLNVSDVHVGTVTLENFVVEYTKNKINERIVAAGCTLIVSNSFEASGYLKLIKINDIWQPDSIQFGFEVLPPNKGIPIATTGIYLQGLNGAVGNLTNLSNISIGAGVKLSDGISYSHGSNSGFFTYLEGQATINKNSLNLTTNIYLGAYFNAKTTPKWNSDIGYANMNIGLDWSKNIYKFTGTVQIPTDYGVKVNGDILLSENAKVFYGNVEIRTPSDWWLIGGKTLGNVGGSMLLFKNNVNASYAAGWAHFQMGCTCCSHWYCGGNWCSCLIDADVGLKYNFGSKSFTKLGASDINNVQREAQSYFKKSASMSDSTLENINSFALNINENKFGDMLMGKLVLDSNTELKNINTVVMGPSGMYNVKYFLFDDKYGFYSATEDEVDYSNTKVNEVYFFLGESFYEGKFRDDWKNSKTAIPKLIQLEHGEYEVIVDLPYGIEPKFESAIIHSNIQFDLEADYNSRTNDIAFMTHYWIPEVAGKNNDAKVLIFADDDSLNYDGRLIESDLSLKELRDNGINVHEANWTAFGNDPDENYYFYGVLIDSSNVQKFTSYTNGFSLKPAIQGIFSNTSMPDSGLAGNIVFLDINNNGKLDLHQLPQKDTLGNVIPENDSSYFSEQAEPSCVSDSLGRFWFDINRATSKKIQNGTYRVDFYLNNDYKVSENSAIKREDQIIYDGSPKQIEIKIERKN